MDTNKSMSVVLAMHDRTKHDKLLTYIVNHSMFNQQSSCCSPSTRNPTGNNKADTTSLPANHFPCPPSCFPVLPAPIWLYGLK